MTAIRRRLMTAIGLVVLGASPVLFSSPAADATAVRLVWSQPFSGPTALADCNAAGVAGRNGGRWDFYRCPTISGVIYLNGYLIIS